MMIIKIKIANMERLNSKKNTILLFFLYFIKLQNIVNIEYISGSIIKYFNGTRRFLII